MIEEVMEMGGMIATKESVGGRFRDVSITNTQNNNICTIEVMDRRNDIPRGNNAGDERFVSTY